MDRKKELFGFIVAYICVLLLEILIELSEETIITNIFSAILNILGIFLILTILFDIFHIISQDKEKNIEEINRKYEDIKSSVIPENSISEKNTDILELMLANMREINDYYVLSKTQAQNSFALAVLMCIIGIILMGVSIFAAFFQANNVISAIIPAVGAAIVEVIAGTSLFVYKKSLSQLNRYFNSLHSNERFLSIVNIVSKASPEIQDDMYFEIIKSQIGLVSTDLVENTMVKKSKYKPTPRAGEWA